MKIKFSFMLVLVCIMLALNQMFVSFIVYFLCLLLHEYTHIFVAKKLGYNTSSVYLTPFGATMQINSEIFYNNHEIIIALSAPLLNFFLLILTVASWWIFPEIYSITYGFAMSNFTLCFFNLLPIYPLDGSKILAHYLNKKTTKTKQILIAINVTASIIFFILSLLFKNISFSLMATLFLLSLCEKQSRLQPAIFQSNFKQSNLPLNTVVVNQTTKLYKLNKMLKPNSLNRFFVIDKNLKVKKIIHQNQLVELFTKNSSQTALKDIK